MNFSDPFGLDPYVQCRAIDHNLAGGMTHCAIRVKNENLDIAVEMLVTADNKNDITWHVGANAARGSGASSYDPDGWVRVARPEGMSEQDFDRAVLNSALRQAGAMDGKEYSSKGQANSNAFVYNTIIGAGSKPPSAAVKGNGSPGLCGGKGWRTGTNCTPQ